MYTDTDTACILPIHTWGHNAETHSSAPLINALPDLLELASTTAAAAGAAGTPENSLDDSLAADDGPSLIIALETDSHDPNAWKPESFVRGIQIVQWTLLAKRAHPIMLDVVGRGLAAAKRRRETALLANHGGEAESAEHDPDVLEWTGPGPL